MAETMASPQNEDPITTWPDLTRAIDEGQGAWMTTMSTLRQLEGAFRTGPKVMDILAERLRDLGLGYLPTPLPTRADDRVFLFRRGTHFGEVIRAINEGVEGSAGDALLEIARKVNRVGEAGATVPRRAIEGTLQTVFSDLEKLLSNEDGGGEGSTR